MSEQDALKTENRILRAKLEKAVQQRDGFMKNYHELMKVPHSERYEILTDCDRELENLDETNT